MLWVSVVWDEKSYDRVEEMYFLLDETADGLNPVLSSCDDGGYDPKYSTPLILSVSVSSLVEQGAARGRHSKGNACSSACPREYICAASRNGECRPAYRPSYWRLCF